MSTTYEHWSPESVDSNRAIAQPAIPVFVLHQTGNCWWLYEKVNGHYVRVDAGKSPATRPGDLINAIVTELQLDRFEVQMLRS